MLTRTTVFQWQLGRSWQLWRLCRAAGAALALASSACTDPAASMVQPPDMHTGTGEPGPRLTWDRSLVPTAELQAPQRARGLTPVRGIIHLHSPHSHDACDGDPQSGGKLNEPCLLNLRKAVCATRQDFAMLTDHATHMGEAPFEQLFLTDETLDKPGPGSDQLLREGTDILGARWRCDGLVDTGPSGHRVVVTVGGENELMPVGLRRHLGSTVAERKQAMGAKDPAAIAAFKQAGGVVLQAHGESRDRARMIALAEAGLGGMEVYNLHANLDPDNRQEQGYDALGAIIGLAPWLAGTPVEKGGPEPDLSLLGFLLRNPKQLEHYDALLGKGHKLHPTLGSDIHENAFKGEMADGERGDSYRRLMRWFTNHLLVPAGKPLGPLELKEALEARRGYGVFELLGPPHGFDFYADGPSAEQRGEIGAEVALGATLHLSPPRPLPAGDRRTDAVMRVVVLRIAPGAERSAVVSERSLSPAELADGAGLTVDTKVHGAGAYRVEVHLVPLHLLHLLGQDAALYKHEYPYLYSGAIFVRGTPPI
jgi:hypothetical protein